MSRLAALAVAIVGLTSAGTEPVRGNGQEFFAAATGQSPELVYFGRIKEKGSGRLIRERAFFTIFDDATGTAFPFTNDSPAHYRSPDVGAAIKELAGVKADPKRLQIQLMVSGYKDTKLATLPRAANGSIELDFFMEPVSSGQPGPPNGGPSPDAAKLPWGLILAISVIALAIAAMTARRLVLR